MLLLTREIKVIKFNNGEKETDGMRHFLSVYFCCFLYL